MKNQAQFEEMIFEESHISANLAKFGGNVVKCGIYDKSTLLVDKTLSKKVGKREGLYVSFTAKNGNATNNDDCLIENIAQELNNLSDHNLDNGGKVLLVGLGNTVITAYSLGKATLENIELTKKRKSELFGICPSVSGITNIESVEVIKGITSRIKPDLVVVIDSLATSDFSKLCCSYQLSSAGIVAGGGVKPSNKLLSEETLKTPIIAIGVPMIINVAKACNMTTEQLCGKRYLCPQEIDIFVKNAGKILAESIDMAFS